MFEDGFMNPSGYSSCHSPRWQCEGPVFSETSGGFLMGTASVPPKHSWPECGESAWHELPWVRCPKGEMQRKTGLRKLLLRSVNLKLGQLLECTPFSSALAHARRRPKKSCPGRWKLKSLSVWLWHSCAVLTQLSWESPGGCLGSQQSFKKKPTKDLWFFLFFFIVPAIYFLL